LPPGRLRSPAAAHALSGVLRPMQADVLRTRAYVYAGPFGGFPNSSRAFFRSAARWAIANDAFACRTHAAQRKARAHTSARLPQHPHLALVTLA